MSTIMRTLRNLRSIGLKEYGHQMQYMGTMCNDLDISRPKLKDVKNKYQPWTPVAAPRN
ncbi:unnamed protein product [Aureobasidium uvarum]|uniref:Uncharacterized protein n=1 Tax=Aureobasidium uvarum TaxID=2773716 RepID=A0A9N8KLL7_9PEZI|nr:unnamed protein product [Aureobasidium uvarum]